MFATRTATMGRSALLLRAFASALLLGTSGAVKWVVGDQGQSCTATCEDQGHGCLEQGTVYPRTAQEFRNDVLSKVNAQCESIYAGNMRYDPSIHGHQCGFKQWRHMRWNFCNLQPPPHTARFCPCHENSSSTEKAPYDCISAYENFVAAWPTEKKEWCCQNVGLGCPEAQGSLVVGSGKCWYTGGMTLRVSQPREFAASPEVQLALKELLAKEAGLSPDSIDLYIDVLEATQPDQLRRLAAEGKVRVDFTIHLDVEGPAPGADHARIAAALLAHTPQEWEGELGLALADNYTVEVVDTQSESPFDCHAEYANWKVEWSQGKQDWCCMHEGKGCPATTAAAVATTTSSSSTTTTMAVAGGGARLVITACSVLAVVILLIAVSFFVWRVPRLPRGSSRDVLLHDGVDAEGEEEKRRKAKELLDLEDRKASQRAKDEERRAGMEEARRAKEAEAQEQQAKEQQQNARDEEERRAREAQAQARMAKEEERRAKTRAEEEAQKKRGMCCTSKHQASEPR